MKKTTKATPLNQVPPQNIEAEQSTLGAMLIESTAIDRATEILDTTDFYRNAHQDLFDVITALAERDEPVDLITVQQELKKRDKLDAIGGISYLTALFDSVPTAANVEHYAKIVKDASRRRLVIAAAMDTIVGAQDGQSTLTDVIDDCQSSLMSINDGSQKSPLEPITHAIDRIEAQAQLQAENPGLLIGLPSGFDAFDRMTAGLQPGDLIIVAARPAMGKTSFAMSIALHVAMKSKKAVAIFSLEMSSDQIVTRALCSEAEISSHRYRSGRLEKSDWDRAHRASLHISKAPITICDRSDMTVWKAKQLCRKLQIKQGLSLIVIDYLQLMTGSKNAENRTQEISEIARGLKQLARDLKVPVIALSQLSRAVENRADKRPMLSDLRESGSIEAEADMVCFLYREAYYTKRSVDTPEQYESPVAETTELIIGKHRNGPTGTVNIYFVPQYAQFLSSVPEQPVAIADNDQTLDVGF